MVLESLVGPLDAVKHPLRMLFYGFVFSSIGLFLAHWVFEEQASIVMVFFAVIACVPLMYFTMKNQEEIDIELNSEREILNEHRKTVTYLMMLFVGMVIGYTIWYVFLPDPVSNSIFSVQTKTILAINHRVSGNAIGGLQLFSDILFNNFRVLIFCILFSFIYGAGAIFILTWNASVIGTAMGNFVKANLATSSMIQSFSLSFLRYFIHGLPEILAYFLGGIAGGIISVAVIKHDYLSKKFETILLDASELMVIAVLVLSVAAFLEVYITPLFF